MDVLACAGRAASAPAAVQSTYRPSALATRRISRNRVRVCLVGVGGGAPIGTERPARPGASTRGFVRFPRTYRGISMVRALGGEDDDDDAGFDANFGDIDRLAAEAEAAAEGDDVDLSLIHI